RGGVDVVVDVQRQQAARLVLLALCRIAHDATYGEVVVVAVVIRHADEVEHRERRLVARLARAAAAHLLVQDGRAREACLSEHPRLLTGGAFQTSSTGLSAP